MFYCTCCNGIILFFTLFYLFYFWEHEEKDFLVWHYFNSWLDLQMFHLVKNWFCLSIDIIYGVKYGHGHIATLWWCFSVAKTGRLVRTEKRINGAKYREVLGESLLLSKHDLRLGWRFIFQHKNNPKHTAMEIVQDKSVCLEKPKIGQIFKLSNILELT